MHCTKKHCSRTEKCGSKKFWKFKIIFRTSSKMSKKQEDTAQWKLHSTCHVALKSAFKKRKSEYSRYAVLIAYLEYSDFLPNVTKKQKDTAQWKLHGACRVSCRTEKCVYRTVLIANFEFERLPWFRDSSLALQTNNTTAQQANRIKKCVLKSSWHCQETVQRNKETLRSENCTVSRRTEKCALEQSSGSVQSSDQNFSDSHSSSVLRFPVIFTKVKLF